MKFLRRLIHRPSKVVALILTGTSLMAHDPGLSSVRLGLETNGISAVLTFARAEIEAVLPMDKDLDGRVSPEEFSSAKPRLVVLAAGALRVEFDHKPVRSDTPRVVLDTNNNFEIFLSFRGPQPAELSITSLLMPDLPLGHRQILSLHDTTNRLMEQFLLSADRNRATMLLEGSSSETPHAGTTSFGQFFKLGIEHILTGYDHLLFLFALLVVCDRFWPVAKIITSFTIAHSITLALAAFGIVNISGRIVEPAIAASIVAVGLENIFRRDKKLDNRWRLTFGLGLIHGLGFASVLQEVGVGRDGTGVALPLIGFNLGVELGQIAVALIVLPILWQLRRWPSFQVRWVPVCSAIVAAAGAWWFIERLWRN
ncbi:MAG: HupE/UreJ family protein [Opitutaceae bacterium]|nr:HupE/UreJ family protein [Verrucomicrobiales bacterium]